VLSVILLCVLWVAVAAVGAGVALASGVGLLAAQGAFSLRLFLVPPLPLAHTCERRPRSVHHRRNGVAHLCASSTRGSSFIVAYPNFSSIFTTYPCHAAGTRLLALGDGEVVDVRQSETVSGVHVSNLFKWNSLMLALDDGAFVEYVHLRANSVTVKLGERVRCGQQVRTPALTMIQLSTVSPPTFATPLPASNFCLINWGGAYWVLVATDCRVGRCGVFPRATPTPADAHIARSGGTDYHVCIKSGGIG
jgi:hypothetical protein